jgi:CRISPR-associated protein Cas1
MPPLYVIHQGAKLRLTNRRLLVDLVDEENDPDLPLGQVSQVVLFGNVGLTTPAIQALLDQSIEVIFLSEQGAYRGRLAGELTPHVGLRRAQYRSLDKAGFMLGMARGFVQAKLRHQRALLLRHNRELGHAQIAAAAGRLSAALEEIEHKTTLTSLRGLEGAATAAYFSGLRALFDPAWKFTHRRRRPPPDPVNVLLSLGYTLLGRLATSAAQTVGLDPYAGYLHEVVYNRPALGLDLLEEFRPVVDGLALWAVRGGQITPQDFTPGPPERPVVLSEKGLRVYLQAFEGRLDLRFTHPIAGQQLSLRQCLIEQARQVAARILEDRPGYQGMGFR